MKGPQPLIESLYYPGPGFSLALTVRPHKRGESNKEYEIENFRTDVRRSINRSRNEPDFVRQGAGQYGHEFQKDDDVINGSEVHDDGGNGRHGRS